MKWYDKQKKAMEDKMKVSKEVEDIMLFDYSQDQLDEMESTLNETEIYNEDQIIKDVADDFIVDSEIDEVPVSSTKTPIEKVTFMSTISKGTIIQGNIEMDGDLHLEGCVNGDIKCAGHVEISGEVNGDIEATSAVLLNATIKGNTICKENITLSKNTNILGDVSAKNLVSNATIKGNVKVENEIMLESKAFIDGNVEAKYLGSEKGAILKGQYMVSSN